jgi:hypothetical protein
VILGYLLCRATAPIMLTILPPDKYTAYADRFGANKVRSEKFTSPLPQYLSDRFGWPQMVEGFAARYNALPPDVRAKTAIFCGNYGEASAVNILDPKYGLPTAISGHQNYFYWGWNGYTGESVFTLGNDPKDYADNYAEVIDLGPFDAPWIMDHEHHHYLWLRHRKRTYAADGRSSSTGTEQARRRLVLPSHQRMSQPLTAPSQNIPAILGQCYSGR